MKINKKNGKGFAFAIMTMTLLLSGTINKLSAQVYTEGDLSFTVRTVTDNGSYSPKHVLAIWIEDSQGFVKTRKFRAANRKQYLYTFNKNTGGNTVDAVTGSTLSSHQTHTVTWDCTDVSGNLVPDGDYTVYVEYTDKHAQGPICTGAFTKGTDAVNLSPADKTYFKDLALTFTPAEPVVSASFGYNADGLTVTFSNNTTGADTYNWDFGDGSGSSEASPVHSYNASGSYTVVLTASTGSTSDIYQENVSVASNISASYTYVVDGLTVTFTNGSSGAESYAWDFGDGGSSIETDPVHTYASGGSYSVILTATTGGDDATYQEDISLESPAAIVNASEIGGILYPNPSTGKIMLSREYASVVRSYRIFGTSGNMVLSVEKSSVDISDIDITDLSAGIYLIQLDTATGSEFRKIVKQ